MTHNPSHGSNCYWNPKAKWVWIGFAIVAAFFLWTEHRAHLLGALPFLIILACPLMHFFMHGHHGHSQHENKNYREDNSREKS